LVEERAGRIQYLPFRRNCWRTISISWRRRCTWLGIIASSLVFVLANLDAAACAPKAAWGRIPRDATTAAGKQAASAMGST
jgi:hypothetical protein